MLRICAKIAILINIISANENKIKYKEHLNRKKRDRQIKKNDLKENRKPMINSNNKIKKNESD